MYSFTITKNADASLELFDWWMRDHSPTKYDGYTQSGADSFITDYSSTEFTQEEKNGISTYYSGLTSNDTVDDKYCRIYDYLPPGFDTHTSSKTVPPCHVDYTIVPTQRLQPIVTSIVRGEVREIIYYANTTLNQDGSLTGDTPVVKEEMTYTRDVAKMALYRVQKIWWYLNDGTTFSTHKERVKYYSPEQRIVEGQTLRKNIIDYMQPVVLVMIMQTESVDYDTAVTMGAELFHAYAANIDSWIYASRGNDLITTVENDTTVSWLDNVVNIPNSGDTIRDYIIDQLNY